MELIGIFLRLLFRSVIVYGVLMVLFTPFLLIIALFQQEPYLMALRGLYKDLSNSFAMLY